MRQNGFPKGSSQYINKLNKIKILNLIREHRKVSRADLAKRSGISAPTVTRIVDSLINEEGLVREIGEGASSGGRKPTMLEFAGLDNFVIGIDLGTTNIYGVLSNLNAETIAEVSRPTKVESGFADIIGRTSEVIGELLNHPGMRQKRIFGIGMAVAGLINKDRNIIAYSPDFHWKNVDIVSELSQFTTLPIIFDNVTRVMALGEMWYGIGRTIKNFIMVNVGYGIGAGIIIDGKPFYGPHGMAGEFGHVTLERNSEVCCECGNHGCLEALASGRSIAMAAVKAIENGRASSLKAFFDKEGSLTAEMVADAAREGDTVAREIFIRAAEYIGIGISGLVNLFSPEAVVIGGGVSQAGDLLFETVRKEVEEHSLQAIASTIRIEPTTFGVKAAAMGSVALILHEVLHLNHS